MEELIAVTPKQSRKLSRLSLSNHKRKKRYHQRFDDSDDKIDEDHEFIGQTNVRDLNLKSANKRDETFSDGIKNNYTCVEDEKHQEKTSSHDDNSSDTANIFKVSYKHCAYVQNLAEISHDILYDSRWNVEGKSLFQWESGENLCALQNFANLYLNFKDEIEQTKIEEQEARRFHLYARMLHRKGPWYCLQDIFLRYYYRDKLKRCEQAKNELNNSSKGATWAFMKAALRECMTDLLYLYSMGMLRPFSSEEEAATAVGDPGSGNLLTERNRLEILSKLGGNPKKTRKLDIGNEILTQLQSQPCISFGRTKHKQRVQHYFQAIAIKSISQKISSLIHEEKSSSDIIKSIEIMWDEVIVSREGLIPSSLPLLQCFKLSERPLLTLRRAIRLYICGGEGPGSMRSDGSNAWISVHTDSCKLAKKSKKNIPSQHINMEKISSLTQRTCQWHSLSYPGLQYRLGLRECEFTDNFISTNTFEKEESHRSQIFRYRREFHLWEVAAELRNSFDYLVELNDQILSIDRKMRNNTEMNDETHFDIQSNFINEINIELGSHVDPLTSHGRRELLHELLSGIAKNAAKNEVFNDVEAEISLLYPNPDFCEYNLGLTPEEDNFYTDAERMICAIAIVCQKALLFRFRTIGKHEMLRLIKRPWLRHLSWECVLANIIWDCVEHMEKRDYHLLAVRMIETILHGTVHLTPDLTIGTQYQEIRNNRDSFLCNYLQMLLSRRTRGKAFDRLIIDKKHIINRSSHGGNKEKAMFEFRQFVKNAINLVSPTSSIPLSYARKLAKQLKTPSSRIISDNMETLELGIRLRHDRDDKKDEHSDWFPLIDFSVANSISHASGTKKRCAYIGSEEDPNVLCHTRSLNVEELAIESYASGTLPVSDPQCNPQCTVIKGGWRGWHCEGFYVRILFRILCFDPILRHTFDNEELPRIEQQSIFLNRYQNAPLDLQVANSAFSGDRSFYGRRRKHIESFLVKLTSLCPQRISDLVYESIMKRKDRLKSHGKLWTRDKRLCRDIRQIKTLSVLAAGFGGKLLSVMFRSLCYDYRHYVAGLPDLLLVRGICDMELVDLGEWIGEGFKETSATSIVIDKDEEFLSNTDDIFSSKKGKNNVQTDQGFTESYVPTKLHLSHDGADISIQCMFIEVKSANDSLDERQKDWLNIIDIAGNARVCKFISKKARDKK